MILHFIYTIRRVNVSSIVFSLQQRAALEAITSDGTTNFADGYRYLRQELQALTAADLATMGVVQAEVDARVYWLTQAIEINENNLSDAANNFIRDITRYGLLWDSKPTGQVQLASDAVGAAVIVGILDNQGIFLPIEEVVGHDVQAAISSGGQTIGGWGGAFYYWDAPFAPAGPNATVGSTISADPNELEKFIALASCTTFNALCRTVSDPMNLSNAPETISALMDMMLTGASAGVPFSIKAAIGERVAQYIAGTRQFFSDNPIHRDWQGTVNMSNASGQAGLGQNGFEINLITGLIQGVHSSKEDFDTFFTIDNVKGSNLGDIIILDGTTAYIEVWGGGGDDRIYGTGGTVEAWGGGGFDVFVVDANSYQMNITRNGQRLSFQTTTDNSSYLLEDFDQIQFYDVSVSFQDLLDQIEQVINGSPEDDILHGTPGIDVINGLGGKDTMYGHEANDRLYGGANDDTFYGGTGSDAMFGDADNDTFHLGEALEGDVDYVNGGAGTGDVVQLSVGAKVRLDAAGAAAIRGQVVVDGFAAPTGHGVGIEMGVGDAFAQTVEIFKASAGVNEVVIGTTASLSATGATSFDFTAGTTDTANFDSSERAILSLTGDAGRSKAIQIGANAVGFFGIDVWNLTGKNDEVYVNQSHLGTQTVVVNAGEGYDRLDLTGIAGPVTYSLDGTIGGTNIVATGFERVHTGAGNDTFHGGDIGEYWHAGGGTNTLMGSLGADTAISTGNLIVDYSASAGVVYLYRETGTSNASVVNGATSAGSQSMGSGDYLSATGWSRMTGSTGTDVLSVVGAYGTLISNGGDDHLIGWKNNDTCFGADGYYETISPGDGNDTIHFGTGGGTLDFSTSTRAAVIDMAAGKYLFGEQEDTVTGEYSKIVGTSYGDRIEGTGNGETIDGGAGSAYDVIYGHGGDDTITFGTGTVHGGEGIDTIKALRGNAIIFGEGGNDKIEGSSNALIYGGDGDDTISASSGSTIHGGDGIDMISAFTGSIIYGDDGNDILSTQSTATDVTIHGGAGGDTITFYAPSGYAKSMLSYSQSDAGVSLIRTGGGIVATGGHAQGDTLLGAFSVIGSDYADTFDLITSDTGWIKAGGGDDVITLRQSGGSAYGEAGDDTFTLTAHDQKAYGGLDNDAFHGHGKMYGEEGDDEFFLGYGEYYSGAGSYVTIKVGGTVYGGSGSNTIHGGLGNDSIHMFDGSDTFIYAAGGGHDMIYGAGADDHFVLDGVLGMQSLSDISANLFQDSDRTELRFAGNTQKIGFIGLTADQVLGLDWSFV